jgi:hypothetical protein
MIFHYIYLIIEEFYYGVSEVTERRNLKFHLISVINFYYIINKLIILISDSH